MIIQNKRIFASILLVSVGFVSFAQGGPPPPTPPPPPGLPLDSFLYILLSSGILLGVRSILQGRRK